MSEETKDVKIDIKTINFIIQAVKSLINKDINSEEAEQALYFIQYSNMKVIRDIMDICRYFDDKKIISIEQVNNLFCQSNFTTITNKILNVSVSDKEITKFMNSLLIYNLQNISYNEARNQLLQNKRKYYNFKYDEIANDCKWSIYDSNFAEIKEVQHTRFITYEEASYIVFNKNTRLINYKIDAIRKEKGITQKEALIIYRNQLLLSYTLSNH